MMPSRNSQLTGCLMGGALGDSLGLPCENLSASRIRKWWKGQWRQRFFFGKGMFSDDTEHAAMTAHALAIHRDDPTAFASTLAGSIRWWFAAVPAGIGLATARSCIRLWIGIPAQRSGVNSAGNGAAMRAAIIGAFFPNDAIQRRSFVEASTRITHLDSRALDAACWVAEAAACACNGIHGQDEVLRLLNSSTATPIFRERLDSIHCFLTESASVTEFASSFRKPGRVSGYAPDSVAVAIYAWLRHRHDFRQAMTEALSCGGDTDTVGAILGGIAGCEAGPSSFPKDWSEAIIDRPLDMAKLKELGRALGDPSHPVPRLPIWPVALLRNIAFLTVILVHAGRRAFPPY